MKSEINLSWGEPLVVRQALAETLGEYFLPNITSFASLGYTQHIGNHKLIEQMKDLCQRQTGNRPKHLAVTNGCTGALNAAIYALKNDHKTSLLTNKRYYPILPHIAKAAGLYLESFGEGPKGYNNITLIDSPSAPDGLVFPFEECDIYDAAYASKTYSSGGHVPQKYTIICGSISKTLGLSGLRLGWIGFNNDSLVSPIAEYLTANYAGLSHLSMNVAEQVLESLDLDRFEIKSKNYLDDNRNEMQRLFNRFGCGSVPIRGMFATLEMGKKEKKALEKANIKWQSGSSWGESDDWARLNLGASREAIKLAVREALK